MIFVWESGEKVGIPFGRAICGLRKNGQRPVKVIFTADDMLAASKAPFHVEHYLSRVHAVLLPKGEENAK